VVFVMMSVLVASGVSFDVFVTYLGFDDAAALTRPWTIITYMFVHGGILHILFNMLFLFFFGPPLEERWGGREFVKYYVICGVGAALFNLIFSEGVIIGASGAVYGVMLAYALNWPNSLIWIYAIFPVKAKYLVLILGGVSFYSAFLGASDGIAHFAHLGGLVVGFVYLKKGWEVRARLEGLRKGFRKRKFTVIPGGSGPDSDARRRSKEAAEEAKMHDVIDLILDKIRAEGIDSLTPEERRFLDEFSRRRQASHDVRH
jgi:membrane associated rhomboid family serine protease